MYGQELHLPAPESYERRYTLEQVLPGLPSLRSLAIGRCPSENAYIGPETVAELVQGPWLRTQLRRLELGRLEHSAYEGPLLEACAASASLRELTLDPLCCARGEHAAVLRRLCERLERLEVRMGWGVRFAGAGSSASQGAQ
jgi:hypothetical protein